MSHECPQLWPFAPGSRERECGIEPEVDIDLSRTGRDIDGTTGITFHRSRCYVGIQSARSMMVALNDSLTVETVHTFDDVAGIHGVASARCATGRSWM